MIAGLVAVVACALIGFGLRTIIVSAGNAQAVKNGAACLGAGIASMGFVALLLMVATR